MRKIILLVVFSMLFGSTYSQKREIRLNLSKGKTYSQISKTSSVVVQTIGGFDNTINSDIIGNISYKVISVKNDVYYLEVNYKKLQIDMSVGANNIKMSSEGNLKDNPSMLLKEMTKHRFYMDLKSNGKIIGVYKIDEMFRKIVEKLPNIRDNEKEQLQSSFGEEFIKNNFEIITNILPENKVRKGDSWKISSEIKGQFIMQNKNSYVLEDIDSKYYYISGKGTLNSLEGAKYNFNGIDALYTLNGTTTAKIKLNRKSGWISSFELKQDISGNIEIKKSAQIPTDMSIPMNITNSITTTDK